MSNNRPIPFKAEKITELIKNLSAKFVQSESSGASLITVTRVRLSENKKSAMIFFTTLPTDKQQTALLFLNRKINELISFIRKNSKIGIIPNLHFEIDRGELNRQKIDEISREIE